MRYPLLVCFLVSCLSAFAHQGGIVGTVSDNATGLPIRGVTVQLWGMGKTAVTNELGQYRFASLPAAPYRIELSHVGYAPQSVTTTVQDDRLTTIQTQLMAASV